MPNYNQAHAFYASVDLHARSRLVHGPRPATGVATSEPDSILTTTGATKIIPLSMRL